MELRLDKCEFLFTKIEFLGYVISKEGIPPTEEGIAAVTNFPIPKDIKEVQSFGVILMQRKKDLKFHPVFYFSILATDAKTCYHSFQLEMLAIVYGVKRFLVYLHGIKLKIVTDCNSLTLALKKKIIILEIQGGLSAKKRRNDSWN